MNDRGLDIPLSIMTGYADIQSAVLAMKLGARDYIAKPVNPEELLKKISEALQTERTPTAHSAAKMSSKKVSPASSKETTETRRAYLEGESDAAKQLYNYVGLVAPTNMSVLINGSSGTGKEYVAHRIHQLSKRNDKPFIAVDCGSIPKELAASEFFGHVKGAFTGALADKTGAFEAADGGTLFLDEVGNLGYETQVQLLRALQERRIRPVGSNREIPVDIRLVAATNEDLEAAIARGTFRADLYHRINSFTLRMPCLRQMRGDIPLFADFFLDQANRELDKRIVGFDAAVAAALAAYDWPGNLRQLKNAVLLLASLFFYAWGEPKYVVLMLVSIAQGYLFGLLVEKYRERNASRLFLSLSILVSLGLLGYFKYADFFLASVNAATGLSLPLLKLSLPIGISFYTFQVLSYVIDVYRGDTAAQRNFIDLAAYVSLFPQLIAGPIVRYSDVALQLRERTHSVSAAAEGVRRIYAEYDGIKSLFSSAGAGKKENPVMAFTKSYNDAIRELRGMYWKQLFEMPQLFDAMTYEMQQDYQKRIKELEGYDFSAYNILTVREEISRNLLSSIDHEIIKLFDDWTNLHYNAEYSKNVHYYNGWCTNSAYKINRKVIFRCNAFDTYDGRFCPRYNATGHVAQIERVLHFLDTNGKPYNGDELRAVLDAAEKSGHTQKLSLIHI